MRPHNVECRQKSLDSSQDNKTVQLIFPRSEVEKVFEETQREIVIGGRVLAQKKLTEEKSNFGMSEFDGSSFKEESDEDRELLFCDPCEIAMNRASLK